LNVYVKISGTLNFRPKVAFYNILTP